MRSLIHIGSLLQRLALLMLLLFVTGCAQNAATVQSETLGEQGGVVTIKSIQVTGEGDNAQLEVVGNKPLTYTSYQMTDPSRAVIDFSQTEPGRVPANIEVNSGNIKEVRVQKQELSGGVITRVEMFLNKDTEFFVTTDSNDKAKLILSFTKPAEAKPEEAKVEAPPAEEPKPVEVAAAPVEEPKPVEVQPAPVEEPKPAAVVPTEKIVSAVNVVDGTVAIVTGGAVEEYKAFTLKRPSRLVIDIMGAKNGLKSKTIPVKSFGVANARIGTYPDRVRIVFDSSKKAFPAYQVEKSDDGLRLVLAGAKKGGKPASVKVAGKKGGRGAIESVDFIMQDGAARIALKTSGNCQVGEPVKLATGFVLTARNCQLPKSLERMLDTSAFASAVQRVSPYQVKVKGRPDAKVLVTLRAETTYSLKREGDMVFVDVVTPPGMVAAPSAAVAAAPQSAPAAADSIPSTAVVPAKVEAPAKAPAKTQADNEESKEAALSEPADIKEKIAGTISSTTTQRRYTGRKVTLEFVDADVRKIFQLLAEVSNWNFLISDDVTGTITLKLVNVPWDQALDVILDAKGLGIQKDGNIVQIKPKSKMRSLADEAVEARKATERMMKLQTTVFAVNFAPLSDVVTQFKTLNSGRPDASITPDTRTNQVIVTDIESAIENMRFLLKTIDSPEQQVMIEARIVEASSNFTRDLGVQWGIHYRDGSASVAGINAFDTGFGGLVTPPPTSGFPSQNSPGIATGVSFGKLTNNIQIDMRLSAAVASGDVKIISTPKVVTLNNKAAKISQGQSIPYQTTSAEGTKTEFIEATLTLEVTPHITADGSVIMKVKASNNAAGSGTPPPINKKEATTELLVKNGETTVIGGIYIDSDTESENGVPFLKDIPLLGWMFKSNSKTKNKTELLIFITPKVIG